jgi:serine/threonine-protein kinase
MTQSFDPDRLQLAGDPVRIVPEVMYGGNNGLAAMAASARSVIAYREGRAFDPVADLVWVDRSGKVTGTVGQPGSFSQVRLSPDEKQVVVSARDLRTSGVNQWVLDLGNQILSQATFEETTSDPLWGPDSQSLLFESLQKGKRDFYRQVIGTRTTTAIYESPDDPKWLDDWSRDGKEILFHFSPPSKLWVVAVEPSAKPRLLAQSQGNIDTAHFSPDAKAVAYSDNESGEYEVWTATLPAFDHRRRLSAHGGSQPWWSSDGRELFYLTNDGKMMVVAVTPGVGGTKDFGPPRELLTSPIPRPNPTVDQYAVTRDGRRFLFIRPKKDQDNGISPITVVVNWK